MLIPKKLKGWIGSAALGIALAASPANAEEPVYFSPVSAKLDLSLQLKLDKIPLTAKSPLELKTENAIIGAMQRESGIETKPGNAQRESSPTLKQIITEFPFKTLLGSYGLKVFLLHEGIGHAATAKLLGCKNVRLIGPSKEYGAFADVLGSYPKKGLSIYESNLISAAGFESTNAFSHILYQLLKTEQVPEILRPLVATTGLTALLDKHLYLLGTAIMNYGRWGIHGGNDFHQIMVNSFSATSGEWAEKEGKYRHIWQRSKKGSFKWKDFSGATKHKMDIAYGIALSMSAAEIALRWKEISYLLGTAYGKNPKAPEGFEVLKTGFYPLPEGGFICSINGVW